MQASGFMPKLVGGHMPYFCRSESCALDHVHRIENADGDGTEGELIYEDAEVSAVQRWTSCSKRL